MKEIKFNIPVSGYKIKYKKNMPFPEKMEIIKITLGDKEFIPNQKIIATKNTKISIVDIYNENLFTEKIKK